MSDYSYSLGGNKETFPPIIAEKIFRIMDTVATVSKIVPEVQSRITSLQEAYEDETAAAVQALKGKLANATGDDAKEIQETIDNVDYNLSTVQLVTYIFPFVWEHCRNELLQILALVRAPNKDLEKADSEGRIGEFLEAHSRYIRYNASGNEITDMVATAVEMLSGEIKSIGDNAGKLTALAGFNVQPPSSEQD